MASHQDKELVCLADTEGCPHISAGTLMLLCSQNHMLHLESHAGKGAEQASQILFIWKTETVCVCVWVGKNTYVYVCVRMRERDRAGQRKHCCSAILNVILDKLCLGNDKCPCLSHSLPLHLCPVQSLPTNAITVLKSNYLWLHSCLSVTAGRTKMNLLHQTASGTPGTDPI